MNPMKNNLSVPSQEGDNALSGLIKHKDKLIANSNTAHFPIVGIGASAGGLEALEQFFANMPNNSGMAFVVIQHLATRHAPQTTVRPQTHQIAAGLAAIGHQFLGLEVVVGVRPELPLDAVELEDMRVPRPLAKAEAGPADIQCFAALGYRGDQVV